MNGLILDSTLARTQADFGILASSSLFVPLYPIWYGIRRNGPILDLDISAAMRHHGGHGYTTTVNNSRDGHVAAFGVRRLAVAFLPLLRPLYCTRCSALPSPSFVFFVSFVANRLSCALLCVSLSPAGFVNPEAETESENGNPDPC